MRRIRLVSTVVLLALGSGLAIWEPTGEHPVFCPADGRLSDLSGSWGHHRDHYNGCAWTLSNENGERAPIEVHAGTAGPTIRTIGMPLDGR